MTSYVSVILNQVILMLILVVAGFISFKTHIITGEGNKHLSNLLILLVNPVVIFVSYQQDFSPELLAGLGQYPGLPLFSLACRLVIPFSNHSWGPPETLAANALSLLMLAVLFSLGFLWGRRRR